MRAGRTPEPSGRRGWPAIATMFAHHAGRGLPRGRSHRPGAEPVRCRRARPRDPRRAGGRRPRAPDRRGVRWPDPVAVIGRAPLWSGPITVDAWRFALNAADELPVKQCLPGPYTLGRRFAADEALGRQGQPRTESMPGTTQPHTTALIAHDGREGLADRVPSRNAEVVGVLIALVGESSAPAVWRGATVSSTHAIVSTARRQGFQDRGTVLAPLLDPGDRCSLISDRRLRGACGGQSSEPGRCRR